MKTKKPIKKKTTKKVVEEAIDRTPKLVSTKDGLKLYSDGKQIVYKNLSFTWADRDNSLVNVEVDGIVWENILYVKQFTEKFNMDRFEMEQMEDRDKELMLMSLNTGTTKVKRGNV